MTDIVSIDPRTAEVVEVVAPEHSTEDVGRACEAAAAAARPLDELGRSGRAAMLRAMADELEAHDAEIVRLADRETGIGTARLEVELKRSAFQLRLFTDVLDDGAYLEATIDHAGETPMGPRPDLRRMLVPIGPVGVFGASNFPLAFSVPGGDTASALAAGCPVVVKAHASHPATSRLCFGLLERIAREAGAPPGTVALVHGLQAGADLVAHPAIQAVGFTGSLEGGTALQEVIAARPQPIPFYGEMSSITRSSSRTRPRRIAVLMDRATTLGAIPSLFADECLSTTPTCAPPTCPRPRPSRRPATWQDSTPRASLRSTASGCSRLPRSPTRSSSAPRASPALDCVSTPASGTAPAHAGLAPEATPARRDELRPRRGRRAECVRGCRDAGRLRVHQQPDGRLHGPAG
jgi:aldehyde dehydrogenase family protein